MANPAAGNEQLLCWEQLQRVNPLFRVSSIFAPSGQVPALLALHALFAAVEESCSTGLDEQVARQKLAWWQQECLGRAPGTSQHPVLRLLHASGGARVLDSPAAASLFQAAHERIDAPSPRDEPELLEWAQRISRPQVVLEAEMLGAADAVEPAGLARSLPAAGLLQLIRESARGAGERAYWWLPLSLQARYQVRRSDLLSGGAGGPAATLVGDLIESLAGGPEAQGAGQSGTVAERHLNVTATLQRRMLERLGETAPSKFASRLQRWRPGDVFAAWRVARRFSRPK